MYVKSWSEQGLIYDMTDVINNSPYNSLYDQSKFYVFTADDKIWGMPALTGGTCAICLYDKAIFKEAGFESFPETWDELLEAKSFFDDKGVTPVAFGNSGQWQINSCWLSTVGDRFTGADWTHSLIENTGSKFTDQAFVDSLTFTQNIFGSGLFNPDFNTISNEDAREYFISGEAASFIGGNWDWSYVSATLAQSDPDRLSNMGLAVIPQPAGATASKGTHDTTLGYGMAISSKCAQDPAKLAAAIDLCYELTGPTFADYVVSNYGLASGLCAAPDADTSALDPYIVDFVNFEANNPGCEVYDSFLDGSVWSTLNPDLQAMLNGSITPEEVAKNAQAAYDAVYNS